MRIAEAGSVAGIVFAWAAVSAAAASGAATAEPPFPDALELSGAWQACVWVDSPTKNGPSVGNVDAKKLESLPEEIALSGGKSRWTVTQWGDCRLQFELRGRAEVRLLDRYDVVDLAAKAGARGNPSRWSRYDVRFTAPRWQGRKLTRPPAIDISVGGRRTRRIRALPVPKDGAPSGRANHTGEEFGRLALEAGEGDAAVRGLWVGPVKALKPKPGPWRDLFDKKSLSGWTKSGGDAHYEHRGGEVVGVTRPNTPNTFLATERDYEDFEFECEVWGDLKFNGGIQFRSGPKDGRNKAGGTRGYQYELDPSGRAWTAGVYDEARRGWIYPPAFLPERRFSLTGESWHRCRIVATGPVIRTYFDDKPVAHLYDAMTLKGYFGLQVHSVGGNATPMEIRFRSVRIREFRP